MIASNASDTDLLACPYNKNHYVMRKRFQVHLVTCRRSHPNSKKVTCPFNVSHVLNEEELEWHVSICPERKGYENFCNSRPPVFGLTSSFDHSSTSGLDPLPLCDDPITASGVCMWDDETEAKGYDPKEYAEKSDILRMPVGLTPAQRKSFRLAERKRLEAVKTNKK